jgi:integrase
MDIKTLAEIMGHQNASITLNRYAHCMMDHKIAMMNRLPKNF